MTVVTNATIAAPIEKVWAFVGDFGGLLRWHPDLGSCELAEIDGAVQRRVQFKDEGPWVVERLIKLDPVAHYFEYLLADAEDPAVIGLGADITLSPTPDGHTHLKWVSAKGGDFPPEMQSQLIDYYAKRVGHLRDALTRSE